MPTTEAKLAMLDDVRNWEIEQTVRRIKELEERRKLGEVNVAIGIDTLIQLYLRVLSQRCEVERLMAYLGKTAEWDSLQNLMQGFTIKKDPGGSNADSNTQQLQRR